MEWQPKRPCKRGSRRRGQRDEKHRNKKRRRMEDDNDLFRRKDLDLTYYGFRSKKKLRRSRRSQSEKTKIKNHIRIILPSEIIIYDILTRVPIKSLMRFRSLCKQWYNLIWDPYFIDLYSRRSNNPPGLIYNPPWSSSRLVFFDINKKKKNKIFFPRRKNVCLHKKNVRMLYSLNGLLLLSCFDKAYKVHDFRVLNPITGLFMILPEPNLDEREYGFCMAYDSITSKYKVVFLGKYPDYDVEHRDEHYVCKIFTLGRVEDEQYSWRDVVVPKLPPPNENYYFTLEDLTEPVFANGSLHWIMQRKCVVEGSPFSGEQDGIFRFDASTETFNTIRLPKYKEGGLVTLHEIGGLLYFLDYMLWVLEEVGEDLEMNGNIQHKKKHEWTKKCDIDMEHLEEEDNPIIEDGHLFAILAHSVKSIKLIFRNSPNGDDSDSTGYFPYNYYSYDTKLKQFDLICEQHEGYHNRNCLSHVNSLAYF